MLRDGKEFTESFLDKVDIFLVVLDATGNDHALSGGDVVHKELLEHTGIDVVKVVLETKAGHAKGVVAIGSAEEEILILREGIILMEMVVEIVSLLVL